MRPFACRDRSAGPIGEIDQTEAEMKRPVLRGGPRSLLLKLSIGVLLATLGLAAGARTTFAASPGVDPNTVAATLTEGTSTNVAKTVHTPPIPPKPDIVFLTDATGSMGGVISNVQSNASNVMNTVRAAQPQADFAAAEYRDAPPFCDDAFIFKLNQAITANLPDVQNGINSWAADGGCDIPEAAIFALDQVATQPAIGLRGDSTRIIVWFGDAPSHDPSNGVTLAQAIAHLQAAHIQVIAIPFNHGGPGLDGSGQATAITAATGGTLLPSSSDDSTVAAAILAGLHNLPVTVTPTLGTCDPNLTVSWDAASKTDTSGADIPFTETIKVNPGSPFGTTLTCHVDFLLNGQNQGADFGEDITITVPAHKTTTKITNSALVGVFGGSATLSANLTDTNGGTPGTPIAGRMLTLTLGSHTCTTGATNASGDASCMVSGLTNGDLGPQTETANFAGDASYLPSSDTLQVIVFAYLDKGAFVIGDGNNKGNGTAINFWGAQWDKNNSLSGGAAPNAFKGFAQNPTPPACRVTWTTDPGNSPPPPNSVPSFMAVIVSGAISQSGSTISGDTPHIVVVQTDAGYASDPGHAGTGTIVGTVC